MKTEHLLKVVEKLEIFRSLSEQEALHISDCVSNGHSTQVR